MLNPTLHVMEREAQKLIHEEMKTLYVTLNLRKQKVSGFTSCVDCATLVSFSSTDEWKHTCLSEIKSFPWYSTSFCKAHVNAAVERHGETHIGTHKREEKCGRFFSAWRIMDHLAKVKKGPWCYISWAQLTVCQDLLLGYFMEQFVECFVVFHKALRGDEKPTLENQNQQVLSYGRWTFICDLKHLNSDFFCGPFWNNWSKLWTSRKKWAGLTCLVMSPSECSWISSVMFSMLDKQPEIMLSSLRLSLHFSVVSFTPPTSLVYLWWTESRPCFNSWMCSWWSSRLWLCRDFLLLILPLLLFPSWPLSHESER